MLKIETHVGGRDWGVELHDLVLDGALANEQPAYTARVVLLCDSEPVGSARWDGEGFVSAKPLRPLRDMPCDEQAGVYGALRRAVHERLATYRPDAEGPLALTL